MNDKDWKELNSILDEVFINSKNPKELKKFPDENFINNQMQINKPYKVALACISISIEIESEDIDIEWWDLIISQFYRSIRKIGNKYNMVDWNYDEYGIILIFKVNEKTDIDNIMDCCTSINTFRTHFNKKIHKSFFNEKYNDEDTFKFGIGAYFSFKNIITLCTKKDKKILYFGEAIKNSKELSYKSLNEKHPILINELMYNNFSDSYIQNNKDIIDFNYTTINNEKIYICSWYFTKYLNWIKNNC